MCHARSYFEVMVRHETDPTLRKYLVTAHTQLQSKYVRVAALLKSRYFAH